MCHPAILQDQCPIGTVIFALVTFSTCKLSLEIYSERIYHIYHTYRIYRIYRIYGIYE